MRLISKALSTSISNLLFTKKEEQRCLLDGDKTNTKYKYNSSTLNISGGTHKNIQQFNSVIETEKNIITQLYFLMQRRLIFNCLMKIHNYLVLLSMIYRPFFKV